MSGEARKATKAELLAGLCLLASAVVFTGLAAQHRLRETVEGPLNGTMLTPTDAPEGVSYSQGPALVFIDSTPGGAQVKLDGRPVGVTPWSSNLSCARGAKLKVELTKQGYRPAQYELVCGEGTARVSATLRK